MLVTVMSPDQKQVLGPPATISHHSITDIPSTAKMAALIREKDWSKTLLGAADTWSPSLTLVVSIMLASGFPMAVRWGSDFVMIYNDGYRPILGEKHPWALGLPFREVWPEVQSQLKTLHEAILIGERGAFFADDLLLKIQRHGAEWEDARFTVSYSPIPDALAPTGVGGVLITAVETTNRVLTEEALRASEERFAGIFRQTSVGVVQCSLDGRFLLANRRFCEIAARTETELLSLRVHDLTHPDERENEVALLTRLVADGVPFIVEKRYLRPDGSEVWVSSNVALTRDGEERPQHFVAVVQDITERKNSERALRASEADFRLVLDSATDAFYCVDTEGTTTMCNLAFLRMLGIKREEDAIGRKLHDVIHHTHPDGSHYPKEECPIYRVAQEGGSAHVDSELFFRVDGTCFPVEYWVSSIMRQGELQGAVCTFVDITERRRSQEQQKLLLGELNHRVKNLFAVTSGVISLSARSAKTPEELTKKIQGRLNALALAHELILPDLTKHVDAETQSTSLEILLQKILSPYIDANETGEHRRLVITGPQVSVSAHAVTNLALILHEFATNAAKYGAFSVPEGSVDIKWSVLDGLLVLQWQEYDGPTLSGPPKVEGFGTVLSDHTIRGQLGGNLSYSWNPNGLAVELSFPVQRLGD